MDQQPNWQPYQPPMPSPYDMPAPPVTGMPPIKRSKVPWAIAGGTLVVILVVVVYWVLVFRQAA